MTPTAFRSDLRTRADIERLVDAFYERVRHDDLIGFIFNDVARTDWAEHLPRMYAFWETVLFRSGGYRGDPLSAHRRVAALTPMERPQFERWLALFHATVDELFEGENAGHIKRCAADMAGVIHHRLNPAVPPVTFS